MSNQIIRPLADRFKALSHPMRLRMVALLKDGDLCVCQMMEVFDLAASTTSEHLSELRRAGLLRERREARWVHVGLADDPQVQAFLATLWPGLDADPQVQMDRRKARRVRETPLATTCARLQAGTPVASSR